MPRPLMAVLVFNEVLSNALAYAVDPATQAIAFGALVTTFVFTLFQRGDAIVEYEDKQITTLEMAQNEWLAAFPAPAALDADPHDMPESYGRLDQLDTPAGPLTIVCCDQC